MFGNRFQSPARSLPVLSFAVLSFAVLSFAAFAAPCSLRRPRSLL